MEKTLRTSLTRSLLLFLVFVNAPASVTAQSFSWVQTQQYSDFNRSEDVNTDAEGNVYITGRFKAGYHATTQQTGAVFTKYSSTGNLLWNDTVYNVMEVRSSIDQAGNLYATGYFVGMATFGNITLISNDPPYYGSEYLVRYDKNGNCLWGKFFLRMLILQE